MKFECLRSQKLTQSNLLKKNLALGKNPEISSKVVFLALAKILIYLFFFSKSKNGT